MRGPDLGGLEHVERISVAALQLRVHARHKESVSAYTGGNREITPPIHAIGLFEEDASNRYLQRCGGEECLDGLHWISPEAKVLRERVGCAKRNHAKGNVSSYEALENLVDCSVATAGENGVVPLPDGRDGERLSATGSVRLKRVGLNAGFVQHSLDVLDARGTPVRMLAGGGGGGGRGAARGGARPAGGGRGGG